jgi:hypothetical protein
VELDVAELVVAVLGLLGIGGAATEGGRRVLRGRKERAEESSLSGESVVTKAEAAAMVAEAERLARIEHNTTAILKAQDEHARSDERRFGELAADNAELHRRWHLLNDKVAPLAITVPRLEEDLRITRRQLSLDSSVHEVLRDEAKPGRRNRG